MNINDAFDKKNNNGVKVRADGLGDTWANEHRQELGNRFFIQDVDGMFGSFGFASHTADRLFQEYVPDNYANRMKRIRAFSLVAMFDRKRTREYALSENNTVSTAWYLANCRTWGAAQGIDPKFFFILGTAAPWEMVELDIRTGDVSREWQLKSAKWTDVWWQAGLTEIRKRLELRMSAQIRNAAG